MEHRAILQEPARKAAKYYDLVLGDLDDTSALAFRELRAGDVDDDPAVRAVLRVVPLNRVAVLLPRLGNATENEDESVVIGAARVVVAADVEVGDLEPQVKVDIVLLAPLEGFVVLAARARDDEEFVVEAAEGVPVPRVLHVVHPQAVENVRLVVHDLEALFQTRWLSLDVSATNQEYLVTWRLNVGEIVLETHLHVNLTPENLLSNQVVLVDVFRVAFEDVD